MNNRLLGLLCYMALALTGCRKDKGRGHEVVPPQEQAPTATSPDRLPPGRLLESEVRVHGFALPRGMRVDAGFKDRTHVIGEVDAVLLSEYVKDRVLTAHVQMEEGHLVFPRVRIRGGDDRTYRFEIWTKGVGSRLVITDLTPPAIEQGLSEAERWKRAGLTPSGRLIDPQNLE